jgi:hypothetical protein
MVYDGRGGGIRTPDPLLPKQMRYQTALRPDDLLQFYPEFDWLRTGPRDGLLAKKPGDQPQHKYNRYCQDEQQRGGEKQEKRPIAPGVAAWFAQVALQQQKIAAIGLEENIEDIAKERNGTDKNADGEIGCHADQRDVRDAANPCGQRHDKGENAGQRVAEAGNQADDAVEAEP